MAERESKQRVVVDGGRDDWTGATRGWNKNLRVMGGFWAPWLKWLRREEHSLWKQEVQHMTEREFNLRS